VGEDRQRVDEVEPLVLVGQRRIKPVGGRGHVRKVSAAPLDEHGVVVASVDVDARSGPVAGDAAAAHAEVEDRVQLREAHAVPGEDRGDDLAPDRALARNSSCDVVPLTCAMSSSGGSASPSAPTT